MHPVRMKICRVLMRHQEQGMTPLEMVKILKDVPQATLYRHLQVLADAGALTVVKEKKVKSVLEKYYAMNMDNAQVDPTEWDSLSSSDKLSYVSYYQLSLLTQYEAYLEKMASQRPVQDRSTFSMMEVPMSDERFEHFQKELNALIHKFYEPERDSDTVQPVRTVAITIVPDS